MSDTPHLTPEIMDMARRKLAGEDVMVESEEQGMLVAHAMAKIETDKLFDRF